MCFVQVVTKVMKHRLQCLIYNQVSQRDRVMNINEIVAMTLRIVTVKMALNGLDIGLTMPYTKIPPLVVKMNPLPLKRLS